ncbi:hypothetical protein B0F90DRAFT_1892715 [Multifurca ochricompacta]|uniref:Arrestin-like N-terminal domain-containing protein n=1 Tax=Multifurca ochricompacta TaxID=376703 RepID=A0AAD4M7V4_9AGAM|nr:hypothetical protein B0F90DRAFT_1892715 [Multifurca ochricompacta]
MGDHTEEELPEYSPNPGRPRAGTRGFSCEHRYALQDRNGHDWISFKVKSRAADSKHMPLFFEGDTIKGEVQLELSKAETLKGLTITIRAGTTAVGQEEEIFLDRTEPIWTPASPSEAKVTGKHTHPFSISIPRDAMVAPVPKATPKSFSLPPTFSERASAAYIDYKLYVTVRRGGLRVNSKLSTSFVFLPRTVADYPSPLRTLAYAENVAILGPDADPEGWNVCDPVKITGTLFNARNVSVQCTVSDSGAFTYASNSPIPLLLTLRGTDVQALDLFATGTNLHLLRTVAIGSEAAKETGVRRSNNTFVSSVAKGVFWPHEAGAAAEISGTGDSGVRELRGELFVPKGSKQSFSFPRFACRYTFVLLPPQVPGFTPATEPEDPLLIQRITITMAGAPGVTPSSQIPPGYEVAFEGNYNVATGFLENGNQRFLHHTR